MLLLLLLSDVRVEVVAQLVRYFGKQAMLFTSCEERIWSSDSALGDVCPPGLLTSYTSPALAAAPVDGVVWASSFFARKFQHHPEGAIESGVRL